MSEKVRVLFTADEEEIADLEADARPSIFVRLGRLHEAVDQAERALLQSELHVYHRDGQLVQVVGIDDPASLGRSKKQKGIERPKGAPQIIPLDPAHLTALLSRVAKFWKPGRKTSKDEPIEPAPIDPPKRLVDAVLANPESQLQPLVAFVEAPLLIPDNKPLIPERVGYIDSHGLLLTGFPNDWHLARPGTKRKWADANRALSVLRDVLATFPFESDADFAATISLLLTGLQRRLLPSAPIFGIGAPTPGTGKSLLADVISIICTGRPAAVMSLGDDSAELEKRFGAVLLAGDGFINIDNVSVPLKSDLLCSIATQPEVLIRVLGVSKRAKITTRTTVVITGNNLVFRGDLTRRVIPIRLNAKCEQPEKIEFPGNPKRAALARRAELVSAALTIIAAYHEAGYPDVGGSAYGSFEDWDRTIRKALLWLDLDDPLDAAGNLRANDPDLTAFTALLQAWHERFGNTNISAQAVVNDAYDRFAEGDREAGRLVHPQLNEALTLTARGNSQVSPGGLGRYLGAHIDRPVDGLILRRAGILKGIAQWRVEHAD
ncbi:MAG TPA: hypothetical protein PKZ35_09255 [Gammaproteobacteria bacterium]|nr:hypothetical protein [Gammaproteobacteria bacterium]